MIPHIDSPLLRVADIARTVIDTLGPGRRSIVWVQGCTLYCRGCWVPETWGTRSGTVYDPERLAAELLDNSTEDLTVSGGEPTEQAAAVAVLLAAARRRGRTTWVYTGRNLEDLVREADPHVLNLLAHTDVLVDGPYEESEAGGVGYRGSRNQRIIRLTSTIPAEDAFGGLPGKIEVRLSDAKAVMIGIPTPGIPEALTATLAKRGISMTFDAASAGRVHDALPQGVQHRQPPSA